MRKMLVLVAALMPLAANAEMSNTYLELAYNRADGELDSIALAGSWGFGGMWSVDFDYLDGAGSGIEATDWEIGFAAHYPLNDVVDAVARVNWEDIEFDVSGLGTQEADGFGVEWGVRGMVSEKIELGLKHSWRNYEGDTGPTEDDNYTTVNFQYNTNGSFSYGVRAEMDTALYGDNYDFYSRFNF